MKIISLQDALDEQQHERQIGAAQDLAYTALLSAIATESSRIALDSHRGARRLEALSMALAVLQGAYPGES